MGALGAIAAPKTLYFLALLELYTGGVAHLAIVV
jgi:hypothetical protein